MRVGVLGVAGRMGRVVVEEARAAGHEVVGGTLNPGSGCPPPGDVPVFSLPDLVSASDAVIDFTHASAAVSHVEALGRGRAIWVLGTTGLSAEQEAAVVAAATAVPVVYAAQFGLGMNILAGFARRLGALLPPETYDAEIIEMHHRQKVDAPSGSAVLLGRAVADGRGTTLEEAMDSGRDGHTGPRRTGTIGFSAVRLGQVVGEHTLLFASATEHIGLTHCVLDRRVYASGAVHAMGWAAQRPAGLYSMDDVLDLRG